MKRRLNLITLFIFLAVWPVYFPLYAIAHERPKDYAARISPDGYSIGTIQVDWIAKPHFYNSGKLIILYIGDSDVIKGLLESVVGSQFAGR